MLSKQWMRQSTVLYNSRLDKCCFKQPFILTSGAYLKISTKKARGFWHFQQIGSSKPASNLTADHSCTLAIFLKITLISL